MNDLQTFFDKHTDRHMMKWPHYFEIYDRHFSRYRDKQPVIMEIGVAQGGSLQMWREYFGPGARIIGVDFVEQCTELREEGFEIFPGDQASRAFWAEVRREIPKLDILIDDGGHCMDQQRVTFEEMFDHIQDDGVYLCEDVHTSYRPKWGGGYKHPDSFIEFSKGLIDTLNAWHSMDEGLKVTPLTKAMNAVLFYDSVIVIEKHARSKPFARRVGRRLLGGEMVGEGTPAAAVGT